MKIAYDEEAREWIVEFGRYEAARHLNEESTFIYTLTPITLDISTDPQDLIAGFRASPVALAQTRPFTLRLPHTATHLLLLHFSLAPQYFHTLELICLSTGARVEIPSRIGFSTLRAALTLTEEKPFSQFLKGTSFTLYDPQLLGDAHPSGTPHQALRKAW